MPPRKKKQLPGFPSPSPMPTFGDPTNGEVAADAVMVSQDQPFEDAEDDISQQIVEESENGETLDLSRHDPGEIDSFQAIPQRPLDDDPVDAPVSGRPTSPPIWRDAHLHPNIPQLRVWRVINGTRVSVGPIDARAYEEDFIAYFYENMPKKGEGRAEFVVRPIDAMGREVMQEVPIPPIDENHVTLLRLRRAREHDEGKPPAWWREQPAAPVGPTIAETLALAERLNQPAVEEAKLAREELRAMRESITMQQNRLAEERLELAGRTGMATEAIAEKMMANDAARQKDASSAQQGVFAQFMAMQASATEREREFVRIREREQDERRERERRDLEEKRVQDRRDYEDRVKREREDADMRLRREKDDLDARLRREESAWAREKEEARRRDEEREKDRERQHNARMEEMRLRAEQDRQHSERMAQLAMRETKGNSAEGLLMQVGGLMKAAGLDPQETMGRLLGGGTAEALVPAIEGAVELFKTGITAAVDYAKVSKEAEIAQKSLELESARVSTSTAAGNLALTTSAPAATGAAGDLVTNGVTAPPNPGGAPPAEAAPASNSKLSLATQKTAREGLRDLVMKLRASEPETWHEHVSAALTEKFAILHYVKEQSMRAALKEAGADDPLVERIRASSAMQNPVLKDVAFG